MSLPARFEPPGRLLKIAFYALRNRLFTRPEPEHKHIVVRAPLWEVRRVFGQAHFTNAWELSYRYQGEDLNMRRPEFAIDRYHWYQTHVRGWEGPERNVTLYAHRELEPTAYPKKHLDEENYSEAPAIDTVARILDEAGLDYERL